MKIWQLSHIDCDGKRLGRPTFLVIEEINVLLVNHHYHNQGIYMPDKADLSNLAKAYAKANQNPKELVSIHVPYKAST